MDDAKDSACTLARIVLLRTSNEIFNLRIRLCVTNLYAPGIRRGRS